MYFEKLKLWEETSDDEYNGGGHRDPFLWLSLSCVYITSGHKTNWINKTDPHHQKWEIQARYQMVSRCFNLRISKFWTKLFYHIFTFSSSSLTMRHSLIQSLSSGYRTAVWQKFLFSIQDCEWNIRLSPGDWKPYSDMGTIEGDSVHAATGKMGISRGLLGI